MKVCKIEIGKKRVWLFVLLLANAITHGYGLWFKDFAWDEEQFYYAARLLGKFFYTLIHGEPVLDQDIVSIYGLTGKYLAFIGLLFYEPWALFHEYSFHEAMVFVRFFSSFLPSMFALLLLFHLVEKHVGENAGWLVLFLSMFAFRWVEQAHYAVPDSLTSLFIVWIYFYLMKERYLVKDLIWMSLVLALAFHSKINVGACLMMFVGIVLLFRWFTGSLDFSLKRLIILGLFWFLWVFLLGLPYLFYYKEFLQELTFHLHGYPFIIKGSPWVYFYFKPPLGVDWGILILGCMGMFMLFRKFNVFVFLNFLWFVIFYALLSISRGAIPRWEVPLIPSLLVLAVYGLSELSTLVKRKWLVYGLGLMAIMRPAYHVFMLDMSLIAKPQVPFHELYKKYDCKRVYYNFSLQYVSLKWFIKDSCNCAIFYEPYWNDLQTNGIPSRFEIPSHNASFIGKPGDSIRSYVRHNWFKVYTYKPRFFTSWTFNPAAAKKVEMYVKPR